MEVIVFNNITEPADPASVYEVQTSDGLWAIIRRTVVGVGPRWLITGPGYHAGAETLAEAKSTIVSRAQRRADAERRGNGDGQS